MLTKFDPGSFSHKEQYTSRFGNITDAFRVLGNLDPESLYLTKKTEPELSKAVFSETQQENKPRTTLNVQSRMMHENKSKSISAESQLCFSF